MKRLLLLALPALLVVPATASAFAFQRSAGDGSLSVRNGDGTLALGLSRGAVIGKIAAGVLVVQTRDAIECESLDVWGADRRPKQLEREAANGDPITVCEFLEIPNRGTPAAIRFRLEGQRTVRIRPANRLAPVQFTLAAVGKGRGTVQGSGGLRDGLYSVNGGDYASLPDDGASFVLGTLVS